MEIKNELFKSNDYDQYKLYRNRIITLTRICKNMYFQSFFNLNMSNMKKTWDGIREQIGRNKKHKKHINAIRAILSSHVTHKPLKVANILNSHFASCGHRLAAKLPQSEKHFTDYLVIDEGQPSDHLKSFAFLPVDQAEISYEIIMLTPSKSFGLYSCPIPILKCASHIISKPLSEIFNISVTKGIYPQKLKIAKVIPVYKSEDETDPNNYRPISLLSIFNRIFEKLMYKRLKLFLDKNIVINKSQYGFREMHSTEHAILDIINKIQTNMDSKLFSCGVFIDLRKAFDTVDHNILLNKLHHYGIRGIINTWFASYLKGREQTTEINNKISEKQVTLCGVPQGSVLGPLLFLIYINDICNSTNVLKMFLFADDTNLLYADKNFKKLEIVLNTELKKLSNWLIANKLTLNINKSHFVIFSPRQKKMNYQPVIKIFDNNSQHRIALERKDYIKYLGVFLDKHLSWKPHIDYISLKISKTIGLISKLRHSVPVQILISLYNSLILPYLSYGIVAWGRTGKTNINRLLLLQKRALRLIHFAQRQEHAIPLFVKSKLLPIQMLYFKNTACLMHDISCKTAPVLIQNLFIETRNVHKYNTRSAKSGNYFTQYSRLELKACSFSKSGTDIWNSLPVELRKKNKIRFKKDLKIQLLNMLTNVNDYIGVPEIITGFPPYH